MTDAREHDGRQSGAIARALLWVVGGLVLFLVAVGLAAPELVEAGEDVLAETLGIVAIAAIPGLFLLGLAAVRRRRMGLDDAERPGASGPDRVGEPTRGGDRPSPDHPDGRS